MNTTFNQLTLSQRLSAPTPRFFRTLRNIGLTLLAISGAIIAAPVALPALVVQIAGYMALAGTVASAVSQTTVDNNALHIMDEEMNAEWAEN